MRSSEFQDKIILKSLLSYTFVFVKVLDGDKGCRGSMINDHDRPRVYLHFKSQKQL